MKKESTKKLVEVIRKLVQKEVGNLVQEQINIAVQDIGKVMNKIIREQVDKELSKHQIITDEYDVSKNLKRKSTKDSFNEQINYGQSLLQAANNSEISVEKYTPKPIPRKKTAVNTGNRVLNEIYSQVAQEMPDNFGSEMYGSMPYAQSNTLDTLDLNMNSMGGYQNRPVQQNQPIKFKLPDRDSEGHVLNLESVPDSIIGSMIKDYRPTIQNIEKIKQTGGSGQTLAIMGNRGLSSNFSNYSELLKEE